MKAGKVSLKLPLDDSTQMVLSDEGGKGCVDFLFRILALPGRRFCERGDALHGDIDLAVKPTSTISSITLINKLNSKDIGVLEEKVASLGMDEVINHASQAIYPALWISEVRD